MGLLIIRRLFRDESGAETVEYALVLGLMALAAAAAITVAGSNLSTWWSTLATSISTIPNSS